MERRPVWRQTRQEPFSTSVRVLIISFRGVEQAAYDVIALYLSRAISAGSYCGRPEMSQSQNKKPPRVYLALT